MKKILIADDEKDTLTFLQRGLSKHGFEVVSVYDGFEAKEAIEGNDFDMIILDLVMPNWTGWQVLEWVRKEKKIATPIIIISAKDEVDDLKRGYQLHADTYLVKPVSLDDVLVAITALFSLGISSS